MSAPGDSILDTRVLPTVDLSDLDFSNVSVDFSNMSSHISGGAMDDIITISAYPNVSPGLMTSTAIDWNSMNLASSLGDVRVSNTLDLRGDNADIRINGVSLAETLQGIQDRLAILNPNPDLESRWQQLRDLREQYVSLERELQEKEQAWAALQQRG
jgi:hypothetical protein